MLFNSLSFLAFCLVFFPLYYAVHQRSVRARNVLLLVASYIFYGAWDWRFLSLIAFTSAWDYAAALALHRSRRPGIRKAILAGSVGLSLAILAAFKYFNFFIESFGTLVSPFLPIAVDDWTLQIILPVGLSFYTFQSISYVVDVYRGDLEPTTSLLDYAVYVALFPQLVAGPIERATHLLPQVSGPRRVTATDVEAGVALVLMGLAKKILIADNASPIADHFFQHHAQLGGADALIGSLAFYVQIYADFSGYSDIARGLARLMGFDLMINFKLPYLSSNPSEFWQRWHISLSQWLRDYLYIPLGGNRRGWSRTLLNLMVTMTLGGLWHGAAWNFVLWGVFHGALLCVYHIVTRTRAPQARPARRIRRVVNVIALNGAVLFGWMLFRAESLPQIAQILRGMTSATTAFTSAYGPTLALLVGATWLHDLIACRTRNMIFPLQWPAPWRAMAYAAVVALMLLVGNDIGAQFIYFQF